VRWLLRIWGFVTEKGMPLEDSTKAGIGIAMQQYGNLPVWLEEFQPDSKDFKWIIGKLKNLFNRESGTKKTFEDDQRVIRGSAIVTGVATSGDSQLRSRYAHLQVAAKNRKAEHFHWFEEESPDFFLSAGISCATGWSTNN
jgi:hypothetical protein